MSLMEKRSIWHSTNNNTHFLLFLVTETVRNIMNTVLWKQFLQAIHVILYLFSPHRVHTFTQIASHKHNGLFGLLADNLYKLETGLNQNGQLCETRPETALKQNVNSTMLTVQVEDWQYPDQRKRIKIDQQFAVIKINFRYLDSQK